MYRLVLPIYPFIIFLFLFNSTMGQTWKNYMELPTGYEFITDDDLCKIAYRPNPEALYTVFSNIQSPTNDILTLILDIDSLGGILKSNTINTNSKILDLVAGEAGRLYFCGENGKVMTVDSTGSVNWAKQIDVGGVDITFTSIDFEFAPKYAAIHHQLFIAGLINYPNSTNSVCILKLNADDGSILDFKEIYPGYLSTGDVPSNPEIAIFGFGNPKGTGQELGLIIANTDLSPVRNLLNTAYINILKPQDLSYIYCSLNTFTSSLDPSAQQPIIKSIAVQKIHGNGPDYITIGGRLSSPSTATYKWLWEIDTSYSSPHFSIFAPNYLHANNHEKFSDITYYPEISNSHTNVIYGVGQGPQIHPFVNNINTINFSVGSIDRFWNINSFSDGSIGYSASSFVPPNIAPLHNYTSIIAIEESNLRISGYFNSHETGSRTLLVNIANKPKDNVQIPCTLNKNLKKDSTNSGSTFPLSNVPLPTKITNYNENNFSPFLTSINLATTSCSNYRLGQIQNELIDKTTCDLLIFCNDKKQKISLEIKEKFKEVSIYDLEGRLIFLKSIELEKEKLIEMNLPPITTGIYLLKYGKGYKKISIQ